MLQESLGGSLSLGSVSRSLACFVHFSKCKRWMDNKGNCRLEPCHRTTETAYAGAAKQVAAEQKKKNREIKN